MLIPNNKPKGLRKEKVKHLYPRSLNDAQVARAPRVTCGAVLQPQMETAMPALVKKAALLCKRCVKQVNAAKKGEERY